MRPYLQNNQTKKAEGVAQVAEACLAIVKPQYWKKKKKRKKEKKNKLYSVESIYKPHIQKETNIQILVSKKSKQYN
jgi:hypothetical protein